MKHERGSSLIVALILLTIITVVAVYSLEGSNIQSKMVANSLFSTLTYQECRNEQESQIRFFNIDNGVNRTPLIAIAEEDPEDPDKSTYTPSSSLTKTADANKVKSDIDLAWRYLSMTTRGGYDADSEKVVVNYLYENDCLATFQFSQNSQTQGVYLEALRNKNDVK
jgi:hypothetical protein